jgi:VCBS repeat-containing protein
MKPSSSLPEFLRPRTHRFALESRQLFDGAAVVEAAHADAAGAPHAAPAAPDHAGSEAAPPRSAPAFEGPHAQHAEAGLPAADAAAHEVYVIDRSIANWEQLAAQVPQGARTILLDPGRSGAAQIAEALQGETGITALHILSHGGDGELILGNDTVRAGSVDAQAAAWQSIGRAMSSEGDILLYGCDVSLSSDALAQRLSVLTGADVASSNDDTGAAARGGDWVLESATGPIEARAFAAAAFDGLLAAPTVDTTATGLTVAEPSTLNAPGAERASLSGWSVTDDGAGNVTVRAVVLDPGVGSLSSAATAGVTAVANGFEYTGTAANATAWLNQLVFVASDAELGLAAAGTTVRVSVTDAENLTATRDLAVTVTPSNDPATIGDARQSVAEIGSTTITSATLAALDPEVAFGSQNTSQLVYALTALPSQGYLTLNGTRLGVGSVFTQADVDANRVVYVHTATGADQNTPDSFAVRVNDGATPTSRSAQATISLEVTPFNQAPSVQGSGSVFEGQPANAAGGASAVGNFIRANGGGDDADSTLTVQLTQLPTDGTLYYTGTATINGVSQSLVDHAVTAADVANGFVIAYADRGGLLYANAGQRDNSGAGSYPFADGFNVIVRDGGGGTGTPGATPDTRITITVRPVNDDPVYTGDPAPRATVTAAGDGVGAYRGDYTVTLTPSMVAASDVDSSNTNLTFRVTSQAGIDQGHILLGGAILPVGGSFTMADVLAGRVQYVQTQGAAAGDTDRFQFQVVDNAFGPRWNADGSVLTREGGVYDDAGTPGNAGDDTLRTFTFTLDLAPTAAGNGGTFTSPTFIVGQATSTYAGNDGTASRGTLVEGGSVVLRGTGYTAGEPGLSYTAGDSATGTEVPASQVIYTILGYGGGGGPGGAGVLERQTSPGVWVALDQYATFTQQDLNDGNVRFVHDGNVEDFVSTVDLRASAGVTVNDNGTLRPDSWSTTFTFYVTPVNDAPTATGSSTAVVAEGGTIGLTSGQIGIADADDATSEPQFEGSPTLPGGGPNYAYDNDAGGSDLLRFVVDSLPTGGTLQYRDGNGAWQTVALGQTLPASLLAADAASTGLRFVSDGSEVRNTSFQVHAIDRWNATSSQATVNIQITNVNDAPQIAADPTRADPDATSANEPLTVVEGSYSRITSAMLAAYDPDSSREQVQYAITSVPVGNRIAISRDGGATFQYLGVGSSFTQRDIDNGLVYIVNRGGESDGKVYPTAPPTDRFTFTLSDGDKEQTNNQFWIYVDPANDPPVVSAPSGPVNLDSATPGRNPVAGFSVSDVDTTAVTAGELDFLQVTVRLLDASGNPFAAADYAAAGGVRIGVGAASGASVDADRNGVDDYLVLRGTRAQVQAALDALDVTFGQDRNRVFQVQVIADDRLRDGSGALAGGANGGAANQPQTPGGSPAAIDAGEPDWYSAAVPTSGALAGNIAAASVTVRASSVNEAATLDGGTSATTFEDQPTRIGPSLAIVVADPESEAFGLPVTVTLSVPGGQLGIGGNGTQASVAIGGRTVAVSGDNTGTLALTGIASDIQALLRDGTLGLTYQGAANLNHDTNGASPGDVTLTISFSDGAAGIGGDTGAGSQPNNAPSREVAIDIVPVNDAPTVAAGSGTVVLTGTTDVPGFSVGDVDDADGGSLATTAGETDFMQVTVRLTTAAGVPLGAAQYLNGGADGVVIGSSVTNSGVTVDSSFDGSGSALVIRGTRAQVNSYLAGLQVGISSAQLSNTDQGFRVEVIADDRLRDAAGVLTGGANGGANPAAAGGTQAVPTAAVDPYATTPAGLGANVAQASRAVFLSSVNDPAHVLVTPQTVSEGGGTVVLTGIDVTDADALGGAMTATVTVPAGFTISAVTGTGGTVSGVGTASVVISGTLAEINSRLDNLRVSLPDMAGAATAADWNGTFRVTVVVNDGGNSGGRPSALPGDTNDPNANPGDFDYEDASSSRLVTTRTFDVTVDPVNDAPVVVGATPVVLAPALEDVNTPAGSSVGALFAGRFSDAADAIDNSGFAGVSGGTASDSFYGIAISTSVVNASQGRWQFSPDGGATWTDVGARDSTNALVLDASAQLRFVPAANYHGTPTGLTVRLVETDANGDASTAVPASGTSVNVGAGGGSSVFSAGTIALATTVTNVNDRPLTANGSLPAGVEDQPSSGATVNELYGASYSDATDDQSAIVGGGNAATAFGGIAVVGDNSTAAQGHWEYDSGSGWTAVPAGLGDRNALLLPPNASLRFVPAADFNGVPGTLVVRVSDQGVTAGTGADLGSTSTLDADATSHWSLTHTLSTSVQPRNDAPQLGGSATNPTLTENGQTGTGVSVPSAPLLSGAFVADVDPATTAALAASVVGGGRITVTLDRYVAGDQLFVDGTLPPGVTATGGNGAALTIVFDGDTTFAQVQAVLNALAYSSSSDNPTDYGAAPTRAYTVVFNDGNNAQAGGNAGGLAALDSNAINGLINLVATNDAPRANDDARTVTEDGAGIAGNLITGGAAGDVADTDPDNRLADLRAVGVRTGPEAGSGTVGTVGSALSGRYGALVLNADGSYTYTLDNGNAAVNALKTGDTLTEVYTYTVSDGAGGTDTAQLTITIQGRTDGTPGIVPVDGNGAATGQAEVREAGLVDGAGGPDTSERTSGSITVSAADGLQSVTVGGTTLTPTQLSALGTTPVSIDTGEGTLVLTGFTASATVGGVPTGGTLSYTYTLKAPLSQPGASESTDAIALQVVDAAGVTSTGTLTVRIVDDVPQAQPDTNSVTEDAAQDTATGNVVGAGAGIDRLGADGAAAGGPVTAVRFGATTGTVGTVLTTAYGQIVLNADGSYTYTLDNGNAAVNALKDGDTLSEVVGYTITDADGDTSTSTLTITIQGRTDGTPGIVPVDGNGAATGQAEVREAGLVDGAGGPDTSERTSGSITVSAADGLQSVTVGGTTLTPTQLSALGTTPVSIDTGEGTLVLTGFTASATVGGVPTGGTLSYTYTLKAPLSQPGASESTDAIALQVVDAAGVTSTGTLTVRIVDDVPQAQPDTNSVTEDAAQDTATGNVVGAGAGIDRLGADGAAAGGPVTAVRFGATTGTVGTVLTTAYGQIVLNADGSYTYTLDNGNAAVNALKDGDTLSEVVGYTITDADGDTSSSTLTITIQGHTDAGSGPGLVAVDGNGSAAGQAEVNERGLVDGPAGPDTSERTTGSIQFSTPDGLRDVTVGGTVVTLAQLQGLGTTPVVIDTPAGTLVLTGFTATTSVGGVPTAGELRYAYVLDGPQRQPGAFESLEVIALAVTDAGGASTPGSLAVRIIDDAPTALDDAIDITEDAAPGFVSGNLRDNDRLGADQANGVPVTGLLIDGVPVAPGSVATLAYGTLVVQPDGRYTYTLDNTNPAVQRLIVGETLVERIGYTLTDADGDTSSATLTVTIRGANDGAFLNLVDGNGADALGQATVHEAGLDARDGSQATTGQMVVAAPDGLDSIQVGDALLDTTRLQALASQPLSITTSRGVLTLTGFDAATGTLRYSYVLGAAQDHRAGPVTDDVQVVVRDRDGDAASGVLRVLVVDDVPTARDDSATVGTARPDPTSVDGNVFGPSGAGRGDVLDRLGSDATAAPVTGIAFDGTAGTVGGPALAGRYGSLVMRADGSYTYAVDTRNSRVLALGSGQTLTEVFVYTLTDADGSASQARLTITIQGASQWNPPTIDPVWPTDLGAALPRIGQGMAPALFVQQAVRESRELGQLFDARVATRVAGAGDEPDLEAARAELEPLGSGPSNAEYVGRDGVAFSRSLVRDAALAMARRGVPLPMPSDAANLFPGFEPTEGAHADAAQPAARDATAAGRADAPTAPAAANDPAPPDAPVRLRVAQPGGPLPVAGDAAPSFSQRISTQAAEHGTARDMARAPVRIRVPARPQA